MTQIVKIHAIFGYEFHFGKTRAEGCARGTFRGDLLNDHEDVWPLFSCITAATLVELINATSASA